ncbi:hypothetical protein A500_04546 [Clostridium sartagoforme AAU1]|uniref:Uncharacterized protein n=1 Tax=Clostridium sartagoforme AAU1 TaxID=1202534 RepID=R9CDM2_9CLOT|nr:hypothetical protein [Clostridium sartagoforme]EOR27382.1 hypothetical protein A500_04546 [Clostridium sartagoforme AAU1]
MRLEDLFNKKVQTVTGMNPITKEPIEVKRTLWSWNCLEFSCKEDDLIALSKVELTDEEFNVIIEGFNYMLNDEEGKELLDDEDRRMSTYAMDNLEKEQCRLYLISEQINVLDDLLFDGILEDLTDKEVEKSLYRKLREALEDDDEEEDF